MTTITDADGLSEAWTEVHADALREAWTEVHRGPPNAAAENLLRGSCPLRRPYETIGAADHPLR